MGFVLVRLTSGKMDNTSIAKASKNTKKKANTYMPSLLSGHPWNRIVASFPQ